MTLKLLISDIDGTLVMHRPHSNNLAEADALIPQSTLDAIEDLKESNIMLAGVTGRTYEQSRDILMKLGIEGPCVFAGGAIIRNLPNGEVLYEANLAEESITSVTHILEMYLADGRRIELNPSSVNSTKYNSIWAKLRKEDAEVVREKLSKVPNIYFVMNDGHGHNSEFGVAILHEDVNKGSGTKKLLELLQVDPSEAACIGDGDNDVPMFNECGLSIAMGNGTELLKAAADHVVNSIEHDGFADVVEIIRRSAQ